MSVATSLKGTAFDDGESGLRLTNAEVVAVGLVLGAPIVSFIASAAGMELVNSVMDKAAEALIADTAAYALGIGELDAIQSAQRHWSLEIERYCREVCQVAEPELLSKRQADELLADIELWQADCYELAQVAS